MKSAKNFALRLGANISSQQPHSSCLYMCATIFFMLHNRWNLDLNSLICGISCPTHGITTWGIPPWSYKSNRSAMFYSLDRNTSTKQWCIPWLVTPHGHPFINSLFYCRVAYAEFIILFIPRVKLFNQVDNLSRSHKVLYPRSQHLSDMAILVMEFQVHGCRFKLFDTNDVCHQDLWEQMFNFKIFIIEDI